MSKFIYYNRNPNNENIGDCVTRAISLGTGLDYYEIEEKLYLTANLLECERLCMDCYRILIENVFKFPIIECEGMLVGEFAEKYPIGIYIIRVPQHLTTIINGNIYDTWDCSMEKCTISWRAD